MLEHNNEQLNKLIQQGKEDGYIQINQILKFVEEESEAFQKVIDILEAADIDLLHSADFYETLSAETDKKESNKGRRSRRTDTTLQTYFNEIGAIPLLTAKEERHLAILIDKGKRAERRLHKFKKGTISLTKEEEQKLKHDINEGEPARNHFIEANLRLVVHIANRYRWGSLSLADLIQEGNMGLIEAVSKFDYRKEFRFSTYATHWIRRSISRNLERQRSSITLPAYISEAIAQLNRAEVRLMQKLMRDPTVDELAKELDFNKEFIERLIKVRGQTPTSLDIPIGEDEQNTLGDLIEDTDMETPLQYTIRKQQHEIFAAEIDNLSEREAKIIRLRKGFEGEPLTLEAIGERFGLTRERIRQIEAKAIKRLRRNLKDTF